MNERNGSKMMKRCNGNVTEKLANKFVRTPTKELWDVVVKMMQDGGGRSNMFFGEWSCRENEGPRYPCIIKTGQISSSHRQWFDGVENITYSEISIDELHSIVYEAASTHTMMTEEEMHSQFNKVLGEEGSLLLSIEKWKRLLKEENWSALVDDPEKYIQSNTCGLCELHQRTPGGNGCAGCSLGVGSSGCHGVSHPWQEARSDVNRGDRTGFLFHARDLIKIMEEALVKLRKPKKTYKRGQWFRNVDGRSLYLLAKGGCNVNGRVPIALVDGEDGGRWSAAITVENIRAITEQEFSKIADGRPGEFTPVIVHTAVMGEKK